MKTFGFAQKKSIIIYGENIHRYSHDCLVKRGT